MGKDRPRPCGTCHGMGSVVSGNTLLACSACGGSGRR
jgi:hypothetical protein